MPEMMIAEQPRPVRFVVRLQHGAMDIVGHEHGRLCRCRDNFRIAFAPSCRRIRPPLNSICCSALEPKTSSRQSILCKLDPAFGLAVRCKRVGVTAGLGGHEILRRRQRGALDQFADDAVHLAAASLPFAIMSISSSRCFRCALVELGAVRLAPCCNSSGVRNRAFAAIDDIEARIGDVVGQVHDLAFEALKALTFAAAKLGAPGRPCRNKTRGLRPGRRR